VKNEVEKAIGEVYRVLSNQEALMARIDERLKALASQNVKGPAHAPANLPCQSGHHCPLNPDDVTINKENPQKG
jgi:hypothetical protein